jgi:hypothetical protein
MTSAFNGDESAVQSTGQAGAEALTPSECWRPLDGDSIPFTTRDEAKLRAAERGDQIAFALDSGDVRHSASWSLTMIRWEL